MTKQLSKAQIDAIKVELAKVGLTVTVKRAPRNAGEILAKSKWYKRPSLAALGRGVVTTAHKMHPKLWEAIRENGPDAGCYRNMYHFPHRS